MRNKLKALVARANVKAMEIMVKKDKGIETLMVIALVCVVGVSLTAMFRTEAGNLLHSVFGTMNTNIDNVLFKEFTI